MRRNPGVKQLPFIMTYYQYNKLYKTYKRPGHEVLTPDVKEELARQRNDAVETRRTQ